MRRPIPLRVWAAAMVPVLTVLTVLALWRVFVPGTTGEPAPRPVAQRANARNTPSPCAANAAPSRVIVSLGEQHAWMCQGTAEANSTAVTTGATDHGDGTPTGTWVVQDVQGSRDLVGPGYREHVDHWIPFHGDFGFHDAQWQTMPFGSPGYRAQGSHGCVHLPLLVAQWLSEWVQVGRTLVTVEA